MKIKNSYYYAAGLFAVLAILTSVFFRGSARKPNIIVILVDTLRADNMGVYGYQRLTTPNLDKFAEQALIYDRAIGASSWTVPSVASVLSGLYPTSHNTQPVRERARALKLGSKFPDAIDSMPEILKQYGYQTAGISANPWISPFFAFDQGFDNFYLFERARAEKLVRSAKKVLDQFAAREDQPFFLYVHFMDPHSPYTPKKGYDSKFSGKLDRFNYAEEELQKINLYDGEVNYIDDQVQDLLSDLKVRGLYDDSVILFLSDHGEAFKEHGHGGHGYHLYAEEVRVPMLLKVPGKSGHIGSTVSHVDILPTFLELAGIGKPQSLPGSSLLDFAALEARTGVYSEIYRVFQERSFSTFAGERLIVEMGRAKRPKNEMSLLGMFDMRTDPLEQSPINDPALQTELSGYLDSAVAAAQPIVAASEVKIDDKSIKVLESLGYIND